MSGDKKDSGRGRNDLKVRVKTARGRKLSSTRWLQRQLNDPFVRQAQAEGLRARSAFKLREIDERYHILRPGARVVDLGAAPGGWLQIAKKAVGPQGLVLGVDLLEIAPMEGVETLVLDFLEDGADEIVRTALGGRADVVLSDMAPSTTGHRATDHLRIVALCEVAAHFAFEVLSPGGAFVAKVFQGGAEGELLHLLKTRFATVRHMKPRASRADSAEMYVIATGFRGA